MLIQLSIQNLAIVERLELSFGPGFSVLTGETGAGKSILLNALGFGLGGKADTGQIRPGANQAEVNLTFDVSDAPDARAWLEEQALAEDETCLIRRVLTGEGRSRAYVNSRPVTLKALQTLGACLIEIHGQHAHVHLLKPVEQRRLLDEASHDTALPERTRQLFQAWRKTRKELLDLTAAERDRGAREELLRFQIAELEQYEIARFDYATLATEHTRLANVGRIQAVGQEQLERLYESEQQSIASGLSHAIQALGEIARLAPEFDDCITLLQEARVQVQEAASMLRRRLERLDADPARLNQVEQKLAEFHDLARKHQVRPAALPEQLSRLSAELDRIARHSEQAGQLEQALESLRQDYTATSAALSRIRQETALVMAGRISDGIQELGMPQGQFLIEVNTDTDAEPAAHGNDTVEFRVSANPGLPPRPLARVASGGELSRISLAIQVTATDSRRVPTLIFDEVDSGVGGRVAEMVGARLRALSLGRQILSVTHLPQVAAQAHHHLRVQKHNVDGMTQSSVQSLAPAERVDEIARMLGGVRITPQTLAHAREMLENSGSGDERDSQSLPPAAHNRNDDS